MAVLKMALLGAGAMGEVVAREVYPWLATEVELAAVIDRDRERATQLADGLGVPCFSSLGEAHRRLAIDGVDIRLPHDAHAPATVEAIALGLDVLVEKPAATSLTDCRAMAEAADRTGAIVAVAENYPHLRAVQQGRQAIDDPVVGEVLGLRSTRAYTLDGVWARATWRRGAGTMAGILWDQVRSRRCRPGAPPGRGTTMPRPSR